MTARLDEDEPTGDLTREETTTPPDVYFTDADYDAPDPYWNGKD